MRAYIAGPYRDSRGAWYVRQNIARAERLAALLWQRGYAPFCPHLNSRLLDGVAPDQAFLEGDLAWLHYAEVCFLVPDLPGLKGLAESAGTQNEIRLCRQQGIPVVWTQWDRAGHRILLPEAWRYAPQHLDPALQRKCEALTRSLRHAD